MSCVIDKLNKEKRLSFDEWKEILQNRDIEYALSISRSIADKVFGRRVFIRGLIEISNVCRNNCLYCGIRRDKKVTPFRLSEEDIMLCCDEGYKNGFRTFVMQGGEDGSFSVDKLCLIIERIKEKYPECAVTLSLGEMERQDYQRLFDAGADRYLLRHEAAEKELYEKIHPEEMSYDNRMRCLCDLKDIGYQTGCGMMIGVPFQTVDDLARDMLFIQDFKPHMIGVGPFIPSCGTPFGEYPAGSGELTVFVVSLLRIMLPNALLPATTALGTLVKDGREKAILAGANVVMPNLTPEDCRAGYLLYDNKIGTKGAPEDTLRDLEAQLGKIGFTIDKSRGDYKG